MKDVRLHGRTLTITGDEADETYRHLPTGVEIAEPALGALARHVAPDSVCIDVGAGFGLHTLTLSLLAPDGHVLSIEPSASAYAHLEWNITGNRIANVTTRQVWPAGLDAGAPILEPAVVRAASTRAVADGAEAAHATVDELVDQLSLRSVDVLRVSVGGAELGVLEGAHRTLHEWRPAVFVVFNSFDLAVRQGILPHVALGRLRDMFPYCHVLDRADGSPKALSTDAECAWFLYDNSSHGPVDDLVCTFEPLGAPGYSHPSFRASVGELTTVVSQRDQARAEAAALRREVEDRASEVEAMRRTLSWRLTWPLRTVRTRVRATRGIGGLGPHEAA